MADLLEPKEIKLADADGKEHAFVISKIPAMDAREIFFKYIGNAVPKIGDYSVNEEMALKMLSYTEAVTAKGAKIRLLTRELVNNHIKNWEMEIRLEDEIATYNCSFFLKERLSTFLSGLAAQLREKVTEILTASSQQSSMTAKPPSTN